MDCHALLQGILPIQGSKPGLVHLLHCRWVLHHWHYLGSPWWSGSSVRGTQGEIRTPQRLGAGAWIFYGDWDSKLQPSVYEIPRESHRSWEDISASGRTKHTGTCTHTHNTHICIHTHIHTHPLRVFLSHHFSVCSCLFFHVNVRSLISDHAERIHGNVYFRAFSS